MKIAIPTWQGRVSPVFDVCTSLLFVEIAKGCEQSRESIALLCGSPQARIALLAQQETDVLICGAISKPVELNALAKGIEVIPRVCGDVERILMSFIHGTLNQGQFRMPGCCGTQRRCRQRGRDQHTLHRNQES